MEKKTTQTQTTPKTQTKKTTQTQATPKTQTKKTTQTQTTPKTQTKKTPRTQPTDVRNTTPKDTSLFVTPDLPTEKEIKENTIYEYNFHTLEKTESLTLSISDIRKNFGKKEAVRGVSFDIHTGEIVGFLGPNGAGKTTVFYMIVGLIKPDSGKILFNGVSLERWPMYKRARLGISYLPQEPSVFRRLTVEKNIIAVLQTIKGMKGSHIKQRVDLLIKEFKLEDFRKQKAFTLSGGERRRTEIARGMALHPYFLLLDEPFTGIDPKSRFELKQIISSLSKKGVGILITDHNERDTLSITDRAFILYEGQIVASGSRTDITNDVRAREIYLGEEYD